MGVTAAPRCHAANIATTNSTWLGSISATTSPDFTPLASKAPAALITLSRNSLLVSSTVASAMHGACGAMVARECARQENFIFVSIIICKGRRGCPQAACLGQVLDQEVRLVDGQSFKDVARV